MTAHTAERITRTGHRTIETESGKALFEVFSGAVGRAEADANEDRLVTVWNSHDQLAAALSSLLACLDSDSPSPKTRSLVRIANNALAAAGAQ